MENSVKSKSEAKRTTVQKDSAKAKIWTHNDLIKAQRGIDFRNVAIQPQRKPAISPADTAAQIKREG